jgi:MFS family permease
LNLNSSTRTTHYRPRFFYGYIIVALCYVLSMLVFGVYNSFGVFFDPILTDFGWSKALTSGAFAVSTLMQGVSGILCGKLTDKIGPRLVMSVCAVLLGAGYILMAYISNALQFYLVYGLIIGAGVGGFWVPLLSTISRWFSRKRGLMLGIFLTGAGAGIFIMPPFINWLIQNYQWRIASAVVGLLTLIICVALPQFIKRDPSLIGELPDGDKGLLEHEGNPDNKGFSLKEALQTRQFWMILILFFCCGWFVYSIIVHIVPYALYSGISPSAATNILAVSGIFSGIGAFISGIIADRRGVKKVALVCLVVLGISLLWFLIFRNIWQLYLFGVVFGFAFGAVGVMEMLAVVWLFGLKANAFILAAVDLGLLCGAAFGPVVAGYIFDAAGSYQVAFILNFALSLVPILLIILIKPISQSGQA